MSHIREQLRALLAAGLLALLWPDVAVAGDAPLAPASSGDETLDNAVAAVVVAALDEMFDAETVSVLLDSFTPGPPEPRGRMVRGTGRMQLGDDPGWIGFDYRVFYDSGLGTAGYPELIFGGLEARAVPNDAYLVQALETHVAGELSAVSGGFVRLQLDRIETVAAGHRFFRIDAFGVADFGLDGISPIRLRALYDEHDAAWLNLDYDLGPGDADASDAATP